MLRKAQTGVRVSDYKNGYSTGERSRKEMTDEEYEVYRKENLKDYEPSSSSPSNPKVYKKGGLRPHQALRKIISDNFGEN
jgi:hypothetical protein